MTKKLGKWLVYWDGGNVHHYFDDYKSARKYCDQSPDFRANIAYVVAVRPPVTFKTVDASIFKALSTEVTQ